MISWSVIVPTYNRPQLLRETLSSLARLQTSAGTYEVIVVDDGGEADLSFVEQWPNATLLWQENQGPAAARNKGMRAAQGAWIALTDDDCCPAVNWLLELELALKHCPEALVGGLTINALTENPYSMASQDLIDFLANHQSKPTFFASNNMAASNDAMRQSGGFDENYPLAAGEDRAFCRSWIARGQPLVHQATALVHHYHQLDLPSYWRQHYRYGRGAFRFHQGQLVDSAKADRTGLPFYLRLVAQPCYSRISVNRTKRIALLALAQLATALGYWRQKFFKGRR